MKIIPDPIFCDTANMNEGDIVGFDPSEEGTGGYEEETIATRYHLSLVLESGRAIGIARVKSHRPPSAAAKILPPAPPPERPREKKRYVSFPF